MSVSNSKRFDIQFVRTACVIIVVLFHTATMLGAGNFPNWFFKTVANAVWVAVPMFLYISGFLFTSQIKKSRYKTHWRLIKQKAFRILVPYTVFTLLIMLQSHFFSLRLLVSGNFWHLWFLTMLFCCFVLYYPLFNIIYRKRNIQIYELCILAFSFAIMFIEIPSKFDFVGIANFFKWSFYFTLGMVTSNNWESIRKCVGKYLLWIPLILLWILNFTFRPIPYQTIDPINTLAIGCAIIAFFYLSTKVEITSERLKTVILRLAETSMGIYIIHYAILIYSASTTARRITGFSETQCDLYTIMIALLIFMTTLVLSYLLTELLKKFKFTRFLVS